MLDALSNNKRIAKNTLILYLRMFVVLGLGLFTSRYILDALGVEDYGIYNVVAGVVALFGFISISMNSASSRFLTMSIGADDLDVIKETFKGACTVHFIIAIIILLLAETVGLWIITHKLIIPQTQYDAALIAYHIAIIISIISIIQTPFSSALIAYERMDVYAGIEMFNILVKFIAVLLLYKAPTNRLVIYMIYLLLIAVIVFFLYVIICRRKFNYLKYGLTYNRDVIIPMLSFSGWDFYGNMSVVARTQGVNVLINMFFGAVLNAASGLAAQVQNAVVSLSSNVLVAAKPQIVKSYASGDIKRCIDLLIIVTRITTALLLLICVPLIMNIDYVLSLWLKEVPQFTSSFSIWCLLFALIANISSVVMSAIHATGKIKRSSLWNGSLYLLVVPISYLLFKLHSSPLIPFIINTFAVIVGLSLNIWYLSIYIVEFKAVQFIKSAIVPILIVASLAFGSAYVISLFVNDNLLKLILLTIINIFVVAILSYIILLSAKQRKLLTSKIKTYVR